MDTRPTPLEPGREPTHEPMPGHEPGHAPGQAPAPAAPAVPTASAARRYRGPRMRTVLLGLVLLVIAVTAGLEIITDIEVDGGIVLLTLLLGGGALLVAGALRPDDD